MKSVTFIFDLDNTLLATDSLVERKSSDIYSIIEPDRDLQTLLAKLPNEKWIFTNGSKGHAETSLHKLGIAPYFSGIVDRNNPYNYMKPDPRFYKLMEDICNNDNIIFFDDLVENLEEAKRHGWVTVLILPTSKPTKNKKVDLHFTDIYSALYFFLVFQKKL